MLENTSQALYQHLQLACEKGQEEGGRENRAILGLKKRCTPVVTFIRHDTDLANQ